MYYFKKAKLSTFASKFSQAIINAKSLMQNIFDSAKNTQVFIGLK